MSNILSKQLCYSFYTVEKLFGQYYAKNLKEFDLTYTQYLVLLVLWEEGSLPLKELGERIGLASNTLTPLVKRLEEKDYVCRLKPETDKRQLYVQLTSQGKVLEDQIKQKINACFIDQIGFSRQEANDIIALNQTLAKRLQEAME